MHTVYVICCLHPARFYVSQHSLNTERDDKFTGAWIFCLKGECQNDFLELESDDDDAILRENAS